MGTLAGSGPDPRRAIHVAFQQPPRGPARPHTGHRHSRLAQKRAQARRQRRYSGGPPNSGHQLSRRGAHSSPQQRAQWGQSRTATPASGGARIPPSNNAPQQGATSPPTQARGTHTTRPGGLVRLRRDITERAPTPPWPHPPRDRNIVYNEHRASASASATRATTTPDSQVIDHAHSYGRPGRPPARRTAGSTRSNIDGTKPPPW